MNLFLYNKSIEEVEEQKSPGNFLEELTQQQNYNQLDSMRSIDSQIQKQIEKINSEKKKSKREPHMNKQLAKKMENFFKQTVEPPESFKHDPMCFSTERSEKKELPVHFKFKQIDAETKKLEDSIEKAPNACQSLLKV